MLGVAVIVVLAVVAPRALVGRRGAVRLHGAVAGGEPEHPLGTDALGRDIFKRVLVPTRLSVTLALLAAGDRRAHRHPARERCPALVGSRLGRLVTGSSTSRSRSRRCSSRSSWRPSSASALAEPSLGIARRGRAVLRAPDPDAVVVGRSARSTSRRRGRSAWGGPPAPPAHPSERRGAAAAHEHARRRRGAARARRPQLPRHDAPARAPAS